MLEGNKWIIVRVRLGKHYGMKDMVECTIVLMLCKPKLKIS
jgi:hypothetical protein